MSTTGLKSIKSQQEKNTNRKRIDKYLKKSKEYRFPFFRGRITVKAAIIYT
ncbi:hypothetical protein MNBD_DELTA03-578 [hydrothermal vent metagenome]|uniref:Uncharacterized protein n=1 Tax=hydrothermal vent metagenome TaxID=652676 RepID=A0A3B0VGA0_9ZZZZ